jgi:hypothetical protein
MPFIVRLLSAKSMRLPSRIPFDFLQSPVDFLNRADARVVFAWFNPVQGFNPDAGAPGQLAL